MASAQIVVDCLNSRCLQRLIRQRLLIEQIPVVHFRAQKRAAL